MERTELAELQELLKGKREELLQKINGQRNGGLSSLKAGGNSPYSSHMADVGSDAMEGEQSFFFATREGKYLTEIDKALERIDNGTYGICHECQEPIFDERLKAVPVTCHCVPCKERLDDSNGSL